MLARTSQGTGFFIVIPFLYDNRFTLFQTEIVCRRQFQIDENSKTFYNRVENKNGGKLIDTIKGKTLWEKEKLLVTSNFSFSHSVFKRLVLQTRKKQSFFGKGLTAGVRIIKIIETLRKGEIGRKEQFPLVP